MNNSHCIFKEAEILLPRYEICGDMDVFRFAVDRDGGLRCLQWVKVKLLSSS